MTDHYNNFSGEYFREYNQLHEQQEELAAQIWEINRKYHILERRIEELDQLFYPYWQHCKKNDYTGGKP